MKAYTFMDEYGSFRMANPQRSSYLYFPLAGESGLKSCVTPLTMMVRRRTRWYD